MERLGYERYGAQERRLGIGGEPRASRASGGERVLGIHLNHDYVDGAAIKRLGVEDDFERAGRVERRATSSTAPAAATAPAVDPAADAGFGLADSPAGQCAWILEKFHFLVGPGHRLRPRRPARQRHPLLADQLRGLLGAPLLGDARARTPITPAGVPYALSVFPHDINPVPERWIRAQEPQLAYYRLCSRAAATSPRWKCRSCSPPRSAPPFARSDRA